MRLTGGQVESFKQDDENVLAVDARFNTLIGDSWKTEARIYRTSQDTFMRRYGIDNATQHKSTFSAEQLGANTYNLIEMYDIQGLIPLKPMKESQPYCHLSFMNAICPDIGII